jgi:hypothetical protein
VNTRPGFSPPAKKDGSVLIYPHVRVSQAGSKLSATSKGSPIHDAGPESRRSIPANCGLTPATGRNDSTESTARVALRREPGRVSIFKRQAYPQRGVYRRRKCVSGHTRWTSSTLHPATDKKGSSVLVAKAGEAFRTAWPLASIGFAVAVNAVWIAAIGYGVSKLF